MKYEEIKGRVKAAWWCLTSRWWLMTCYKRLSLRVIGSDDVEDVAEAMLFSQLLDMKGQLGHAGVGARIGMIETIMKDPSVLLISETEQGDVAACHSLGVNGKVSLGELAEAAETYANEEIKIFAVNG